MANPRTATAHKAGWTTIARDGILHHGIFTPASLKQSNMSTGNSITILTIGILILACSRLTGLFRQPAMVPASTDVPTAWQSFSANTRAKFMLGILLLGFAYAATQVLDSGKGLQAFALVLILLPCGIGGIVSVTGAVWQHRYYAMQTSEIALRSRAMTSDTLALAALLASALFFLLSPLAGPATQPNALATSLYQAALYLSIGLAVSIGSWSEPPFFRIQAKPQINWRSGAFMLAWIPFSVFKEDWLDNLSPILWRNGAADQIVSAMEAGSIQQQLVILLLGGFLLLLALPFLPLRLQVIRSMPFLSSLLLGILPAIYVAAVPIGETGSVVSPFTFLAAAVVGAVIAQLLWRFCEAFVSWLQLHRTNREIAAYPFHYLSIVGLIALSWIGIVEADGIDRYFILVAQCTALSSWCIRRLA